jgi:RimJ/RimL family protein N-acetyltransferase
MNVFDTNQLVVSRFNETHEADFYALNSHPEVMRYIRPVKTEDECRTFLKDNIRLYQHGSVIGRYHVAEKATHSFAGTFSVLMMPDRDAYHIGYALMPWAQGRGWAKELVVNGLKWVFESTDQNQIFAITEPDNTASANVLQKTGFSILESIKQNTITLDVYYINRNP